MAFTDTIKQKAADLWATSTSTRSFGRALGAALVLLAIVVAILGFLWDSEPGQFDIRDNMRTIAAEENARVVTGTATVATLIGVTDVLLNKRGGYITNDITPPGIFMDNVPEWEFGVLVQSRDMVRTLRNTLSRSQSQSTEDASLIVAENQYYLPNDKWWLPETEGEYTKGAEALRNYLGRLGDDDQSNAQFYARADNLRVWLSEVETRLGSLSQRLSSSIGKRQLDTSLAGDRHAAQSTGTQEETTVKTPWLQIDNVFYEARGTTWALLHLLRAIEIDFHDVLDDKNALISMEQIIRELEPTQEAVWSPMILNGSGFGALANHSLVMASHVSRANAAIADLRRLLEEG